VLLERDRELETFAELLEGPERHGGRVVLIRGEAGIGKSALIQTFQTRFAQESRWHIGYCDDLQTPQPFAPLWDIAAEVPAVAEALRAQDRYRVFESVFDLLGEPGPPVVLVLEDTHWSDEATLDAIRYLGRRIARTTGLLVITYRTGEVGEDHPLRSVVGDLPIDAVVRIEPSPLSRAAVARIVDGAGLDPDQVMASSRGNPFLVTEMRAVGADAVPVSVRDSVMARVERLDAGSRALLKAMAVIPGHIGLGELISLTGANPAQLAECERMELIEMQAGQVAFRHDLIRRAIESTLTYSELADTHARVLDLLPAGTDPARLVHHARGANDIDRFVPLALEAARRAAAVSSNREAVAHYRSLEHHLAAFPEVTAGEILLEWALIEHYLEDPRAVLLFDSAIEIKRRTGTMKDLAAALVVGSDVKRARGLFQQAHEHVDEAIAVLHGDESAPQLAAALAAKAWLLIHRGDIPTAEALSQRALELADRTGNAPASLDAASALGTLAYVRGEPGGLDMMEGVRRRARDLALYVEEVSTLLRIGRVAIEIRDLARAADYGRQARSAAARHELSVLETEAAVIMAEAQLGSGEWSAAEDQTVEAIGRHPAVDVRFERLLGVLGVRSGRGDAMGHLERSWKLAEASGEIDHLLEAGAGLLEAMWVTGPVDTAMVERCAGLVERGIEDEYPWPAGWLAFWLWSLDALADIPPGLPSTWNDLFAGRVETAARTWESRGYPYEQALCLAHGTKSQQLEALDVMEQLGATQVAGRLRRDLRQAGVSVPRGRGRATRSHGAGLTRRQAEVLDLLAAGLSNPEIADRMFLSTRTVENHVSAVMSKLGAATRADAVAEALRRDLIAT
jgi:ATP/maltotriose-dependent transcriptional regulator MalT